MRYWEADSSGGSQALGVDARPMRGSPDLGRRLRLHDAGLYGAHCFTQGGASGIEAEWRSWDY